MEGRGEDWNNTAGINVNWVLSILYYFNSSPLLPKIWRFPLGLHINSDPDHCHILPCAGGKPQWGYFYRAFQGYKTGRRGSRIVKVTQSAAKVVTGVSVSLSCAERGTRLRCGLLNIYFMSHRLRHVVCSIKWYGTVTLQSCHVVQML